MSNSIHSHHHAHQAHRRPVPTQDPALSVQATSEQESAATAETTEAPRNREHRPGKAHVQQNLRHLDRAVRHALKDALKEAEGLDQETVKAYRGLAHDFRDGLQSAFQAASEGGAFDHAALLSGVSEAITGLTASLQALRGPDEAEAPAEPPVDAPVDPVRVDDLLPDADPGEPEVGGLLSEYA